MEISNYEDPKFYDRFSRALDEVLEQGMGGLYLTAWGVGCIVRAAVAMGVLVSVDADCIYLFENGEIVERGTHGGLMELDGRYAEMFRCQAKYYQED